MKRITNKRKDGLYELTKDSEIYGWEDGIRLVQIVGAFEDTEEELGIDIITLFKALKDGIYVRNGKLDKEYFIRGQELVCDRHGLTYKWGNTKWYECYDLYGKTWALTKEELT